jgi:hypothetical protein
LGAWDIFKLSLGYYNVYSLTVTQKIKAMLLTASLHLVGEEIQHGGDALVTDLHLGAGVYIYTPPRRRHLGEKIRKRAEKKKGENVQEKEGEKEERGNKKANGK